MSRKIFLLLSVFFLVIRAGHAQPGPVKRTALINLQRSNIVESSRAGQIGLTDSDGNQRYAQYVEIDLVPIATTPTTTGNTSNYSEFVTTISGDIWYIDWQGRGILLSTAGGGGSPDADWLKISDNTVPYSIHDSIYTDNYAAINLRRVWPNAQLLLGDSASLAGGNGVVYGLRNARWGFYREIDATWSSVGQEGTEMQTVLGTGTTGLKVISAAGTGPTVSTAPFRTIASINKDSTIIFNDYKRTRNDTATIVNFLYTDLGGVLRSSPVTEIPGTGITADNGLTESPANNVKLGGTLTAFTTIDAGSANALEIDGTSTSNTVGVFRVDNAAQGLAARILSQGRGLLVSSANSWNAFEATSSGGAIAVKGTGSGAFGFGVWGDGVGGGVFGVSTAGTGIEGQTTSGLAGAFTSNPTSTNTVIPSNKHFRTSSGTAANGIGQSIDFEIENANGTVNLANQIISKWTNATAGTRTSDISFTGVNNAVTSEIFGLAGNGAGRLTKYGIGTFTGTAAFTLQVDASGNIIEGAVSGGGVPSGTDKQTLYFNGTTLTATSAFQNNGTEVSAGSSAPLSGVELYVNGNTRTDGAILTRGAGAVNTDGASTVKLLNTTAVTGNAWHLLSKDDGTFSVTSTATDMITVNNTTGAVAAPYGFFSGNKESITAGSSTALADLTWLVVVNPVSVLATHTITLPAAPVDRQEVDIFFGGTVAANQTVVTTLIIAAGAGETLYQNVTPTTAKGGDCITYRFELASNLWRRKQ